MEAFGSAALRYSFAVSLAGPNARYRDLIGYWNGRTILARRVHQAGWPSVHYPEDHGSAFLKAAILFEFVGQECAFEVAGREPEAPTEAPVEI